MILLPKDKPPGNPHEHIRFYPRSTSRPVPPEVPEEFATDFQEACAVLSVSEKASAALSRRCLQNVLQEKGGATKKHLADQIREVVQSGELTTDLADTLTDLRIIGNFAAHPIKSTHTGEIIDVEPAEAKWLLDTLEELFDHYFVRPARFKAMRDATNSKLKAAGRPLLKGNNAEERAE